MYLGLITSKNKIPQVFFSLCDDEIFEAFQSGWTLAEMTVVCLSHIPSQETNIVWFSFVADYATILICLITAYLFWRVIFGNSRDVCSIITNCYKLLTDKWSFDDCLQSSFLWREKCLFFFFELKFRRLFSIFMTIFDILIPEVTNHNCSFFFFFSQSFSFQKDVV